MKAWDGQVVSRSTVPKSKARELDESDVLAAKVPVTGKVEMGLTVKKGVLVGGWTRTREDNPHISTGDFILQKEGLKERAEVLARERRSELEGAATVLRDQDAKGCCAYS